MIRLLNSILGKRPQFDFHASKPRFDSTLFEVREPLASRLFRRRHASEVDPSLRGINKVYSAGMIPGK